MRNRSKVEVANWASGGQSHFTDFKKKSKSRIFWTSVRGVWDDFGWLKSCFYWSRLMFGSVWTCLLLIWDNLMHLNLLQRLPQKRSEKVYLSRGIILDFHGTPVMAWVDTKVVFIGPCWCLGGSGVDKSWSGTTSLWHICRRPANRPFCLDPI